MLAYIACFTLGFLAGFIPGFVQQWLHMKNLKQLGEADLQYVVPDSPEEEDTTEQEKKEDETMGFYGR